MKSMISIFIKCNTVLLLLILCSCGKDKALDLPGDCDTEDIQVLSTVFIDATILYGQDPSTENCESYKEATENYLEIIKECGNTFLNGVEETEQILADLDC